MANNNARLHPQERPPHGVLREKHHKNTIFIIALAFLLAAALFCGAAGADATHTHDGITFEPWVDGQGQPIIDRLPNTSGNYYLITSVDLTNTWTVPLGTTNLCLNGKSIRIYASGAIGSTNSVIRVESNATLNLYDCGTTGCISDGGDRGWDYGWDYGGGVYVDGGTFSMYGGSITNNSAKMGGGVYVNSGTFNMHGGSITENSKSKVSDYYQHLGGGVYVNGGTFNMHGGSITDNSAFKGCGVYVNSGTFTMSGGSITGNKILNYDSYEGSGGGVYVNSGTFNIKDAPVIKDNKNSNGFASNVYLDSGVLITGVLITVTGPLTDGADIRINNPSSGVFAQGVDGSEGQKEYTVTDFDGMFFHPDSNEKQEAKVISDPTIDRGGNSRLGGWYAVVHKTLVTFKTGESSSDVTYTEGEVFSLPDVPTKTGDTFLGWKVEGKWEFFCICKNGTYQYLPDSEYYGANKIWTYTGKTLTLTAVWSGAGPTPAGYTVTTATEGSGSITGTPTNPVTAGTAVELTAAAGTGYHFKQWVTAGLSSPVSTAASLTFSMPAKDVSAVAEFEAETPAPANHKITVETGITGGSASATYAYAPNGTEITITAYPKNGYKFSKWTVTGATVSSETANPATFTVGSSDVTVTAVFEIIDKDITIEDSGNAPVNEYAVPFSDGEGVSVRVVSATNLNGEKAYYKAQDATDQPADVTVYSIFNFEGEVKTDDKSVLTVEVTLPDDTLGDTIRLGRYDGSTWDLTSPKTTDNEGDVYTYTFEVEHYCPLAIVSAPSPSGSYTLSIPSEVTLEKGTPKSAEVGVTLSNWTEADGKVSVTLDSNDVEGDEEGDKKTKFFLKLNGSQETKAYYQIKQESGGSPVEAGNIVLGPVPESIGASESSDFKENLIFSFTDNPPVAGTYTGTITFTASVSHE